MLDPSVQVDIHGSEGGQCKPLPGASGLVLFDAIVFEEPFSARGMRATLTVKVRYGG